MKNPRVVQFAQDCPLVSWFVFRGLGTWLGMGAAVASLTLSGKDPSQDRTVIGNRRPRCRGREYFRFHHASRTIRTTHDAGAGRSGLLRFFSGNESCSHVRLQGSGSAMYCLESGASFVAACRTASRLVSSACRIAGETGCLPWRYAVSVLSLFLWCRD